MVYLVSIVPLAYYWYYWYHVGAPTSYILVFFFPIDNVSACFVTTGQISGKLSSCENIIIITKLSWRAASSFVAQNNAVSCADMLPTRTSDAMKYVADEGTKNVTGVRIT